MNILARTPKVHKSPVPLTLEVYTARRHKWGSLALALWALLIILMIVFGGFELARPVWGPPYLTLARDFPRGFELVTMSLALFCTFARLKVATVNKAEALQWLCIARAAVPAVDDFLQAIQRQGRGVTHVEFEGLYREYFEAVCQHVNQTTVGGASALESNHSASADGAAQRGGAPEDGGRL